MSLKVLNIEDTVLKHIAIVRCLNRCRVDDVDWAKTAEDGLEKIRAAVLEGKPYDLLVLDMHFSARGKDDTGAGFYVLEQLKKEGLEMPTILCSSIWYDIPEILGCVQYSERRDNWEEEMADIVNNRLKA